MTTSSISSGQTSSFLVASGGGGVFVLSGGSAVWTTVDPGGSALILAGGVAESTIVLAGAVQDVGDQAVARGTTVAGSNAHEDIAAGGRSFGATVAGGGSQLVFGAASGAVVESGGVQRVYSTGLATGSIVFAGGQIEIVGEISPATINSGGVADAYGVALGTVVDAGGQLNVYGRASGAVLNGGTETVYGHGVATGTTVNSGGLLLVQPDSLFGGPAGLGTNDVVNSGGEISVAFGAIAVQERVNNGGTLLVQGNASGTVIGSGGIERVVGGSASGEMVQSGGLEFVSYGQVASANIASGGYLVVLPGDVVSGTVVQPGGIVISTGFVTLTDRVLAYGPSAASATIAAGMTQYILPSGNVVAASVTSGGLQEVESGGTAVSTSIDNGGIQSLINGVASGASVMSGGVQSIHRGLAVDTVVSNGGYQIVSRFNAVASGTTLDSGGYQVVSYGGSAISDTINSGAVAVFLYGEAIAPVVHSGGLLVLVPGSTMTSATIAAGGRVASGGVLDLASDRFVAYAPVVSGAVFGPQGSQYVLSGGTSISAVFNGGSVPSNAYAGLDRVGSGGTAIGTSLRDGAAQEVNPGGTTTGTIVGYGAYQYAYGGGRASGTILSAAGTQYVYSGGAALGTVVSAGGILSIASAGSASGIVLQQGGEIAIVPSYASGSTAVLNAQTDVLTISEGGINTTLQLSGDYTHEYFHLSATLYGGNTAITVDGTPCYCRDTLILTDHGETPVQHLKIGDRLITAAGAARPLRWIGRRSYNGRFAAGNRDILPIVIAAGALAYNIPRRELRVSPLHALFIDDALIPASLLVNNRSIVQAESVDRIDYFHLELDSHDVILAEGAPAESFVDDDSRGLFHNAHEYPTLYPDAAPVEPRYCAPLLERGEKLEAIRRRLLARTEPAAFVQAIGTLRGCLDTADRAWITGWAIDEATPDNPVTLRILANGAQIARVLANAYRPDLAAAGIGNGCHGFVVSIPGGLSPLQRHLIQVQREHDSHDLANSPLVVEPADRFDAAMEHAMAQALAALDTATEQARALTFLSDQLERLLQSRADADASRTHRAAHRQLRRTAAPGAFRPRALLPRALLIDDTPPDPSRDAGAQVVLSHLRALQQLGYEVSFCAREPTPDPAATAHLREQNIACWQPPFYNSVEEVLRRQHGCFDVVYLHRISNAAAYLALARRHQPRARILYSVADLHHLRLARQAAIESRPELLAESARVRLAECTAAFSADAVLTHSAAEAAWLRQAVPSARVHVLGWHVPATPIATPFAKRWGVAFIGNYAHRPNQDAAHTLARDIMPLVWAENPAITCLLAGRAMPPAIRALAGGNIRALEDFHTLPTVFEQIRLSVAPLQFGAGIKGKVLASFAASIPCVMTPIAAEGLALPPALHTCVGETPQELADMILRLHKGGSGYRAAVKAGNAIITGEYTNQTTVESLSKAINRPGALPPCLQDGDPAEGRAFGIH